MRLKKDKLLKLMQDDSELEEGIRCLIVNEMESLLETFCLCRVYDIDEGRHIY